MKVYQIIGWITLATAASFPCFAEEVTMGKLLDAEAQVTLKKMNEELGKISPGTIPAQPLPLPKKIDPMKEFPPQTLAIYGLSSTGGGQNYRARLSLGGSIYSVKVGSFVNAYVVSAITVNGTILERMGPMAGTHRKNSKAKSKSIHHVAATSPSGTIRIFAPLVADSLQSVPIESGYETLNKKGG